MRRPTRYDHSSSIKYSTNAGKRPARMEGVHGHVERLNAGQEFTTYLLEGRSEPRETVSELRRDHGTDYGSSP